MIITNDFIFIHFPKAGGSFVKSILSHLYETVLENEYRKKNRIKKFFSKKPFYCETRNSQLLEAWLPEFSMHNGRIDIDAKFKKLPVFSVIREPLGFYSSLYRSQSWLTEEMKDNNIIKKQFPKFPNIGFEEFMKFINEFFVNKFINLYKLELKKPIGLYTMLLILQFEKDPFLVFSKLERLEINENEFIDNLLQEDINYLDYDNLLEQLHGYLSQYYKMDMHFIYEKPKKNVSINTKLNIGIEVQEYIREIDNLGFAFYESIKIK